MPFPQLVWPIGTPNSTGGHGAQASTPCPAQCSCCSHGPDCWWMLVLPPFSYPLAPGYMIGASHGCCWGPSGSPCPTLLPRASATWSVEEEWVSFLKHSPHLEAIVWFHQHPRVLISSASILKAWCLVGIRPCTQAGCLWSPRDLKCQSLDPSTGPTPTHKCSVYSEPGVLKAPEKSSGLRMQGLVPIPSPSWISLRPCE